MDRWAEQFEAMAESLESIGTAMEGHNCSSEEVLGLATVVQYELNQRYGHGNGYTATLVRMVGHAMPQFETEVPAALLRNIGQLMRLAALGSASGAPLRAQAKA